MLVKDLLTPSLKRLQKELEKVPEQAFDHWVAKTPVDSGRARRSTSLKGSTIVADYPYAKRLDEGWSRQARTGMSRPTMDFVKRLVQGLMRK
jgi:hypothetical protein